KAVGLQGNLVDHIEFQLWWTPRNQHDLVMLVGITAHEYKRYCAVGCFEFTAICNGEFQQPRVKVLHKRNVVYEDADVAERKAGSTHDVLCVVAYVNAMCSVQKRRFSSSGVWPTAAM